MNQRTMWTHWPQALFRTKSDLSMYAVIGTDLNCNKVLFLLAYAIVHYGLAISLFIYVFIVVSCITLGGWSSWWKDHFWFWTSSWWFWLTCCFTACFVENILSQTQHCSPFFISFWIDSQLLATCFLYVVLLKISRQEEHWTFLCLASCSMLSLTEPKMTTTWHTIYCNLLPTWSELIIYLNVTILV